MHKDFHSAARIAAEFAAQFDALTESERERIAREFVAAYAEAAAAGGDDDQCYSHAYHRDGFYGLLERFQQRSTGGADWSVNQCFAVAFNGDEEGMFILDDEGSWSLVVRWLDVEGDARIETVDSSDEWPQIVNLAHRLAKAMAGLACR